MGLANTKTRSSTGRRCSAILIRLDYNKYFCFRSHWTLERGSSHFSFIKMYRWLYSKPSREIIGGRRGRTAILHSSGGIRLKIRISSMYICHMSAQAEGIHQEKIFTIRLAARIYFHTPAYWWQPRLPVLFAYLFFLTTSSLCREAILLIYEHPDYATIKKKIFYSSIIVN